MPVREEKLNGQQIFVEYTTIFFRRKLWFFIPFILGILLSIVLIRFLPKTYLSTTLILIEEQKIPEDIVRSTVSEPIAGRLSTLRQQILSRSFLQKIIDRFGLFKKSDAPIPIEEQIEMMRNSIDIKTMGGDRLNAFSLSFVGSDPTVTMNVTNELASLLIQENLKVREQMVEGTRDFIDGELESLKRILEQQEAEISTFKQTFSGELPGQMDASLRTLDRLQLNLQETKIAIKAAAGVDPLAQAWTEQRQKLATLERRYQDTHPDVLALKKEVKELEERLLARDNNAKGLTNAAKSDSLLSRNFQDGFSNSLEVSELKLREKRIEAQIFNFEHRIENVPKREQQLAVLSRDYDNTQKNYQTLLDKKLTAKISENLEKRQKGEQFRILDLANFPEKPYKPDPVKMAILGCFLGIVGGIGLVLIREMADSSIRTPEELSKLSSIPVLASILDYENFPRPSSQKPRRNSKADKLAYMEKAYAKK